MRLIFGGTFDPVHNGHIKMATEIASKLEVDSVYLMPCYEAVHKEGVSASAGQRLEMLRLATTPYPLLKVDEREIKRGAASFTYDSLLELRSEIGDEPLCLVMGSDTALGLGAWRNANKIPSLTNVVVLKRPKNTYVAKDQLSSELSERLSNLGWRLSEDLEEFKLSRAGACLFMELSQIDVSSTKIRKAIKENNLPESVIPNEVRSFICDNALYC